MSDYRKKPAKKMSNDTVQMHFMLRQDLKDKAERIAKKKGISMAGLIRMMLNELEE